MNFQHGQIENIVFPSSWLSKSKERGFGDLKNIIEFSPENNPEIVFAFYCRGYKLSPKSASQFQYALSGEPGELSDKVILRINDVLGNLANQEAFSLDKVFTQNINQKKVLVITGKWITTDKLFWGLMFDAYGDGSIVEEIYFEAREKFFNDYINEVMKAVYTIKWKNFN